MKQENQGRFAGLMVKMAVAHRMNSGGNEFTLLMEVYWGALQDISASLFERACERALKELDYFPKISEIRRLALEESRKPQGVKILEAPAMSRDEARSWIARINAALEEATQKPTAAQVRRTGEQDRKRELRAQAEKLGSKNHHE